MYKLFNNDYGQLCMVRRLSDTACIPLDNNNTDYANFKKEVLAGAELQDDTGNVMTQANEFIGTLP